MVDGRSTQAHLYDRDAARQLAAHLRAHSRNSHSHHHDVEIDAFAHRHGLRRRASLADPPTITAVSCSIPHQALCLVKSRKYLSVQIRGMAVALWTCVLRTSADWNQASTAGCYGPHGSAVLRARRYLWVPSMFQHVGVHSSTSGVETAAGESWARIALRYRLLKVTQEWDSAQRLLRNLPGGERGALDCGQLS